MNNQPENTQKPESSMKIDIGQITATGNVVIAGRDAIVHSSSRGINQDDRDSTTVKIGGVDADAEEAKVLETHLTSIEDAIEKSNLLPSEFEAAKYNASALKQQMTSTTKPNEHLLVQATEALLTFGPDITGAVVGAFTTPLAGKITSYAGERALAMYNRLRALKGAEDIES